MSSVYPDECHGTVVHIEMEYVQKLIELRIEYKRQLATTTNSEEYNKVVARHRALSEELHAIYSYKQEAYKQVFNLKFNTVEQLAFDYITKGKNE